MSAGDVLMLDGSMLIQLRMLSRVKAIAELPFGRNSRQPTHEEIADFLSFLSLLAVGSGFRYDPTVPDEDLAPFLEAKEWLGLRNVAPISTPIEDEFVPDMKSAFGMSTACLDDMLDRKLTHGHQPIPAPSVERFISCIRRMKATHDPTERIEIAFEQFNRGEKGAKLLVGLASQDDRRWLDRVAVVAERCDHEALMSSLINLFRTFLLSSWAGRHGAIFAGSPDAVQRLSTHQLAFWRALEKELASRGGLALPKYEQKCLDVPMIGVALLMMAPRNARPIDLIGSTISARNELAIGRLADTFWQLHFDASIGNPTRVIKEAANDLWDRVRQRGGPKREEIKSLGNEATAVVSPAAAATVGTTVAALVLAEGADLTLALGSAAAGFLSGAIWELLRTAKRQDRPAAALSNLITLHQDALHLIDDRVQEIWKHAV